MTKNMVSMVSHGLFERMACEESRFTGKSEKCVSRAAVGPKQTMQTMETMVVRTEDAAGLEANERDAIQNEARYAARQSIPQERMVAGLIRAVRSGKVP